MDFLKDQAGKLAGGQGGNNNNNNNNNNSSGNEGSNTNSGSGNSGGSGGFLDGIANKFNSAAGGGAEGEKNEDYLDKGVDYVQEKFLGGGKQDNESAVEQAKDEQISDFIRDKYKTATGSEIPIKDKPTTFDRNTD